jgi:diacylglycerol kinase family enzyme
MIPTVRLRHGCNATVELGGAVASFVIRAHALQVLIETDPPRLVETDGSVVGHTPITATIRRAALTVIGPARA